MAGRTTAAAAVELAQVSETVAASEARGLGTAAANSLCFAAGTPMLTCSSGTQPIETLRRDDGVLSLNEETGAIECRKVLRTFERDADDLVSVTWSSLDGSETSTLHVTQEHPFKVKGRGWVSAATLAIGDEGWTASGAPFVVMASHAFAMKTRVFNVEVERNHNYFVGLSRILAHNQCAVVTASAESAAGEAFEEGAFSITEAGWAGYPGQVRPPPGTTFRLLQGAEYDTARKAASSINDAMRAVNRTAYKGTQIHEIHPVKFGGSPVDLTNKMVTPTPLHYQYTNWWNQLQRDLGH
jgi:filamentous hemagglutinin